MFRNQEKTKIQYLKEVYIIFAIFASDAPSPLAMAKLKRHPKHIRFVYKANQTKVNLSSSFDQVWLQTQFFFIASQTTVGWKEYKANRHWTDS